MFQRGTGGDLVADFTPGADKIQLVGLGFSTFVQLQPAIVENGGTAAVNLGLGDFVVIAGIPRASLAAGDFLFS